MYLWFGCGEVFYVSIGASEVSLPVFVCMCVALRAIVAARFCAEQMLSLVEAGVLGLCR